MPPKPPNGSARKGNAKSNSRNPQDWRNFEFANIRLNNAQQEEFRVWFEKHGSDVVESVRLLLEGGHKVTLSPDEGNSCIIASVTCRDELSHNYGYVLTSRSDDWWEAIALCAYKDQVICGDEPWSQASDTNNWG